MFFAELMNKMKPGAIVGLVIGLTILVGLIILLALVFPKPTRYYFPPMPLKDRGKTWPKTLFLTYKSLDKVPAYVMDRFRKHASGFKIEFYDDQRCVDFLSQNFPPEILARYQSLKKGCHRADLWRYCALWFHGGVYLDIKTPLELDLMDMFPDQTKNYTVKGGARALLAYCHQGILVAKKGDPALYYAIHSIIKTRNTWVKLYYLVFTRQFYLIIQKHQNRWILFEERCSKCDTHEEPDAKGFCCVVYDPIRQLRLCSTRDPNFLKTW
jgi:hypothetical protein